MNRDFPESDRVCTPISRVKVQTDTVLDFVVGAGVQDHTMTLTQCQGREFTVSDPNGMTAPFSLDPTTPSSPILTFTSNTPGEYSPGSRQVMIRISDSTYPSFATYDHVVLARMLPNSDQNLTRGWVANSTDCYRHPYPYAFGGIGGSTYIEKIILDPHTADFILSGTDANITTNSGFIMRVNDVGVPYWKTRTFKGSGTEGIRAVCNATNGFVYTISRSNEFYKLTYAEGKVDSVLEFSKNNSE